jgi:hypothetical protein
MEVDVVGWSNVSLHIFAELGCEDLAILLMLIDASAVWMLYGRSWLLKIET